MVFNFVVNFYTHKVVDEAFLLLDVSDGGADRDVVRQLIKVTEQQKHILISVLLNINILNILIYKTHFQRGLRMFILNI